MLRNFHLLKSFIVQSIAPDMGIPNLGDFKAPGLKIDFGHVPNLCIRDHELLRTAFLGRLAWCTSRACILCTHRCGQGEANQL